MSGPDTDPSSSLRSPSGGGLRFRIPATVAAVALAGLSAVRLASASFGEAPIPIGEVASLDGDISGTVHLTGGRLLIYSGDRFQSNDSSLAVNFVSGGSLVLCPHSHLQILSADQNAGVMFAFQEGGSQGPFPVHPNDVVLTPDWRIQMTGNMPPAGIGTLQLSTSRRGELCLSSNAQPGQFFRVSELAGDSVFEITGQSSIRFAGGHINNVPGGCSCEGVPASLSSPPAVIASSNTPAPLAATAVTPPIQRPSTPAITSQIATNSSTQRHKNQRPQDVAGYARSLLRLLFGR